MNRHVGSLQWAALGGGALNRQDRLRLIGQVMLTRIGQLPEPVRRQLGFTDSATARVDLEAIRLPDSPAALRASEHCQQLSAPWLFNHCLRTYVWAALLAQVDHIKFDAELLFVASALHDLGLTAEHSCQEAGCACFAVEGARAAQRFATQLGWPAERSERLAEAISLHLNVRVGLGQGAEAHLLHEGAALDVIGARIRQLGPRAIATTLERYPRLDIKSQLAPAIKEQARLRPNSRAEFLVGLGFTRMIRAAPLGD